jgi:hypothetical protein
MCIRDREIREGLTREVAQERWTGLDRALQRDARDGTVDLVGRSVAVQDREFRALLIGRLQRLGEMGLAERLAPNRWQLSPDLEPWLRAMGERGDIIRRMQRALGAGRRELATFGSATGPESFTGRLVAKGIADPMSDRGYLVVDGVDGRAYHTTAPPQVDLGGLPIGAVITVANGPKPRPADRAIAELAQGGIYRTSDHRHAARRDAREGRDLEAVVEAHVRRLEALRRAGIVERLEEGVWRVPQNLIDRGRAYDARRSAGVTVDVRSYLPIGLQTRAMGATWLDSLLVRPAGEVARTGFGHDVRAALAEREKFLVGEGLAERRDQRVHLARNLLTTLRSRDLENAAGKIQAETGLPYRPTVDGERVSGTFRRSVILASGRFAMIDDGFGFSLFPWRSVLADRRGQLMTAVCRRDYVSWTVGSHRGFNR